MFEISGRSAIITGSGRGFGKEFAKRLLEKGAKVCIADLNKSLGLETLKELSEKFGAENLTFVQWVSKNSFHDLIL